jgi:hypothetical protein
MADKEKENLKALLKYWVAHNQDHSVEFKEWAGRAQAMGEHEVAVELEQAVAQMDKATALFRKAFLKLSSEGK